MRDTERLVADSFDLRGRAWERWGALDTDVLAHLINPSFMGGPWWPGLRESFRVARRPDATLVASDGLSDPFDEGEGPADVNGLGLECFAVSDTPVDPVAGSWLFDLVWQLSQFAAARGDITRLLDNLGLVTTELYDVAIPKPHQARFLNAEGRVGVLLGLTEEPIPSVVKGPLSPIRLVSAKLLTVDELAVAVEGGADARRRLAAGFSRPILASSLTRRSVAEG